MGRQCIGAKVNHKLVPLSQPLRNGDQIEVPDRRKKQQPKEDWMSYVVTAKAKQKIDQALREQKKKLAVVGRETVQRILRGWGARMDDQNIGTLAEHFRATSATDLFWQIARGRHDLTALGQPTVKNGRLVLPRVKPKEDERTLEEVVGEMRGRTEQHPEHRRRPAQDRIRAAPAATRFPGDDVFGLSPRPRASAFAA